MFEVMCTLFILLVAVMVLSAIAVLLITSLHWLSNCWGRLSARGKRENSGNGRS